MSPDGTIDTPRMPVAEHRRRLANGFCQVMRGVADAAGPLASFGPAFDEAVAPRQDPRPDADGIFNAAFVDVPASLKQSARDHRRTLPVQSVPRPRKAPGRGLARTPGRQAGPTWGDGGRAEPGRGVTPAG